MATKAQIDLDEMINDIEFGGLTEVQKRELIDRMDSFQKDPTQGITWREVKANVQRNLRELKGARS